MEIECHGRSRSHGSGPGPLTERPQLPRNFERNLYERKDILEQRDGRFAATVTQAAYRAEGRVLSCLKGLVLAVEHFRGLLGVFVDGDCELAVHRGNEVRIICSECLKDPFKVFVDEDQGRNALSDPVLYLFLKPRDPKAHVLADGARRAFDVGVGRIDNTELLVFRQLLHFENQLSVPIGGGDRAPDTPELNVGGEPLRLFDVFRGPHFTLLRPFGHDGQLSGRELRGVKRVDVSKAQKQDSGAQVYVDAFGHIAAAYGLGKGEYMLVRPDGYVG